MYSLVFAADMYATVFKKDPLDPATGEKYKNSILVPGGSREELDSLTVRCYTSFTPGRCEVRANSINLLRRNSLAAPRTQKPLRSSCSAIRRSRQLIFNLRPYFMALLD
jgi:Peptidase family M3